KLYQYVYKYTTMSEGEFNGLWSNAQRALQTYDNAHTPLFTTMSNLDTAIYNTAQEINSISDAVSNNVVDSINSAKIALQEYEDILGNIFHGYSYNHKGKVYVSLIEDRDLAAWEIQSQLSSDGYNIPTGAIIGGLKQYAQGTTSATGGLSLVGEKGAELRILNQGDGIIPANITKNLWNMGINPTEFFKKIARETLWSGFSGDSRIGEILQNVSVEIKPSITVHSAIHIAGDATQSTVNALKKETENIANLAAKKVMNTALQYSNVPRKY
ncbi:MAG: hypothetical protein IJ433_01990, partial [Ruminococcus sp.]|nr:hypothetical protein [Ruminococcus sp.]